MIDHLLLQLTKKVALDLCPNGDLVVIISKGKVDSIYEFGLDDLEELQKLLYKHRAHPWEPSNE